MKIDTTGLESRIFDALAKIEKKRYFLVINTNTSVARFSKNTVEYFNLPGEYVENSIEIWGNLIHPEDRKMFFENISTSISNRNLRYNNEFRILNSKGNYVNCISNGIFSKSKKNSENYDLFICVIENRSVMDNKDLVTNLYNIYEFQNFLYENKSSNLTILNIEINGFADINDLYGFEFGNKVLANIAEKFLEILKNDDRVFKLDGVKFAFCFFGKNKEEIEIIYRKILYVLQYNVVIDDIKISISLSCGAIENAERYTVSTIISSTRFCLEQSKKMISGDICYYSDEKFDLSHMKLEIIQQIKQDITTGFKGFYMCYQPILNSKKELVSCEALVRWKNEKFGVVSPNIFIPVLENDSSFFEFGKWILKTSIYEIKRILKYYPDLVLNVNLSYNQLSNPNFKSMLTQVLDETNFPAKNLCLELTERCRILELGILQKEINFINSLGIKVAIDDFGTGFSSLFLFSTLKIDTVKIDKEFVDNIENNKINSIVVDSISSCTSQLGISTCIEGVETESQFEYIKDNFKIDKFQGFLFSKPIPYEDFRKKYVSEEEYVMSYSEQLKKVPFFSEVSDFHMDNLTGVLKREYAINYINFLLENKIPFSLQIIDVDNFKLINDCYGHRIGDKTLIQIGKDLIRCVGENGVVSRYGGDEFLVVNTKYTEYDEVCSYLRDLYGGDCVFRKSLALGEVSPFVTATIGSASYPLNAKDFDELFECADKALYRGKFKGRNCYITYVHEKHKDISIVKGDRSSITTQLKKIEDIMEGNEDLNVRINKALQYISSLYEILVTVYLDEAGTIIGPSLKEKSLRADIDLDLSIYMDPVTNCFVCDSVEGIRNTKPLFFEIANFYRLMSLISTPVEYKKENMGYLIFAEITNARIWQDENMIVLKYLAKLIAIAKN